MATVYIQNEDVDHIRLNNNTGSALEQYEFTVIGGLAAIADNDIASGAVGGFHVEDGLILKISDFVAGEDTFGTVDAPVYWDPATGDFSDTSTSTYYQVGIVKTVKNSNGVVEMTKFRNVVLVSGSSETVVTNTAAIATNASDISTNASNISTNADDITEIKSLSGIPFFKTATLTAAAAATPVDIVSAAEVAAISATGVVVITSLLLKVNGATAWTDATATIVTIQDTEGTPVVGATYAKAQLTGEAVLDMTDTGVTLDDPIDNGLGFTAGAGIQIAGDANFGAGSDIIVIVSGFII